MSAGLVAIHPIAEALKDERSHSAWLRGRGAFTGSVAALARPFPRRRAGAAPEGRGAAKFPGVNLLDLRVYACGVKI